MPRILLVDDTEDNLDMLERRLKLRKFEVVVARNGIEAVSAFTQHHPDLILMDMLMPEMDGYEATRQIRQLPEGRGIPIIGLTALAMAGDREKVFDAGCSDYASKPIDFEFLITKIQSGLASRSSGDS